MRYGPRGVTAVVAPWNFPVAIPCGMTSAALATGNAVVLKPAEQSPGCALMLVRALRAGGVPASAISLLPGEGDAGAALVAHPGVHTIAFTGSMPVGVEIARAAAEVAPGQRHLKRVVSELGGKNCVIVDSDADLDEAVPGIVSSAFVYAGQKCSAAARVLVHEAIADQLIERVAGAVSVLVVGQADQLGTDVPPVIERAAQERVDRYAAIARDQGRIVARVDGVPEHGWFCPPTVAADLPPDSPVLNEEIFGPLLAIDRVKNVGARVRHRRRPSVRADRRPVRPRSRHRPLRPRAVAGREPVREPRHHGSDGRPPAVRWQPPVGDRQQGRRARLPAPVRRAPRRDREHDAPRARGLKRPDTPEIRVG